MSDTEKLTQDILKIVVENKLGNGGDWTILALHVQRLVLEARINEIQRISHFENIGRINKLTDELNSLGKG